MSALPIVAVCGSCRSVIPIKDAERCWYCGDDLCIGCWDARGHCGHPVADGINAMAAKGPVLQADMDALMEQYPRERCPIHGFQKYT